MELLRSYFELTRLHKFPLGNILIIWPSVWGLFLAAYDYRISPVNLATQVVVFAVGSTLLHSAACVINDICDRDFDAQIGTAMIYPKLLLLMGAIFQERTKNRPLVVGTLPLSGAWTLLGVLTSLLLYLLSFANTTAKCYGIFGIFPLHAIYPLMKRWTYWPQAWLGLAMNWGLIVAYTNVSGGHLNPHIIIFFAGTVCWSIVYDTIYGCQDKKFDIKVGIKSTSILFGDRVKGILTAFAMAFLVCMTCAGFHNWHESSFFLLSCGGAALHLTWQLVTWRVDDRDDCGEKFKSNGDMGYIIWAGLLLDYWKNSGDTQAATS